MKNLKNYFGVIVVATIVIVFVFACSNDNISNKTVDSTKTSLNAFECFISGETVSNAGTNNAFSIVKSGNTTTYTYNSTFAVNNVSWSILSANPAGSITLNNDNGTSGSVTFASNFESGYVLATGTDSKGQICGPVISIKK
jgi:hypothetical protein